ncbi:MAG: hypothetical protein GEU94_15700 [Micromonosporaceae bacterium]|nr:hypothetical protein [Micromonosporaceae bacterium]
MPQYPHSGEMPQYGYPGGPGAPGVPGAPGGPAGPGKSGGGKGVFILIAAILLVLLLVLGVGAWWYVNSDRGFAVGDCIEEGSGKKIACDKGAFEITKKVKNVKDCPDPQAPSATDPNTKEIFCLKKVK